MGATVLIPLVISGISMVASAGINYIINRKKIAPNRIDKGRNSDLRISNGAGYGEFIPRIWGTIRLAPILIHSTGVREVRTETRETTGGGKGGGGQTTITTNYSYYTTLQLLACKNPVQSISRIWADANLIYNLQPDPNLHFYEGEGGTRTGGASITADALCSSGFKVTGIGSGGKLTFTLPGSNAPIDPFTTVFTVLTVYYKTATAKTMYVSADGDTPVPYVFPGAAGVQTYTINLDSHPESLEFSNAGASAPDIDRISVWYSYTSNYPIDIPVTGINDPYIEYPYNEFAPYAQYNYKPIADADGMTSFSNQQTNGIRIYTGTPTQTADPAIIAHLDTRFGTGQGQFYASAHRGSTYAVLEDRLLPNAQPENYTMEVQEGTTAVSDIVTDLYTEKGIDPSYLDLTNIAGLTRNGLIVHELTSPGKIINYLEDWYQFKMVEVDGKIRACLNNSEPVFEITSDDLRAHLSGSEMPDFDADISEPNEQSLVQTIYVNYMDGEQGIDYHNNDQSSSLFASTLAEEILSPAFPFVATKEEAKTVADKLLVQYHNEAREFDFMAMPGLGKYTPGDCGDLVLSNATHRIRLQKKQMALTGPVRFTACSTQEVEITSSPTAIPNATDILLRSARFPANTELFIFESQVVQLTDEGLGVYVGVSSKGYGRWSGAALHDKLTPDGDFVFIANLEKSTPIGLVNSALPDNTDAIDETNSLTIYFYEAIELESVTADDLTDNPLRNLIRVGDEWMQFRTATADTLPAGSYYKSAWIIENLTRGKFGTSTAKASHSSLDKCMVYTSNVRFIKFDAGYKDKTVYFTAPTFGQSIDNAPVRSLFISGQSLIGGYVPADLPDRVGGLDAPVISQLTDATNTMVQIAVTGFPQTAKHRQIEISVNSDMTGATSTNQNAIDFPNGLLPNDFIYTKTSEVSEVYRYFRVSHAFADLVFGAPSDILDIEFADDTGSGGSGGGGGGGVATPPSLGALSFDAPTDTVSGPITNNGGAGDINVLRQLASGDFLEVATGAFATMVSSGVVDIPTVDGDYNYKLSQDGIDGFSNVRSITVDVDEPGGEEGANGLEAAEVITASVRIVWLEFGATGTVRIYRKDGYDSWFELNTVAAGVLEYTDTAFVSDNNYRYKLTQDGTLGESNTIYITVFV